MTLQIKLVLFTVQNTSLQRRCTDDTGAKHLGKMP